MSAVPTPAAPRRLGRFEILRILGKGAQGTVYLARDTHLGREVALTTLNLGAAGAADRVRALLDEARLVSRLQHPNIVTLFDAGEDAGAPYLVFEYVEGRPLSTEIAETGRIPPARAAKLARQVLKGIAFAHAQHVVHRDLKPANIMLSKDGAARVMDFGIARHSSAPQGGERALYGTPAYLPPEYIDRREFTERGDVFATGMVLYEMLAGAPAVSGRSVFEILHRIANEPFAPPSKAAPEVDERLEAIVMRALSKDPASRYESAAAMDAALAEWLAPVAERGATDESGTLEFLIRRMRHKSDLPALSNTIGEVNRAVSSGNERASVLCDAILKDFSLTNKLLRMVNTAFFRQYGGAIGTVSRAVAILGFDNVRNVVMSLVLVEHLQNKAQAGPLRDEIAAAYLAGVIGRELAQRLGVREAEETFICAMFHRLGKLLATFYLHDEVQAIERLGLGQGLDEARAAREVLGVSYAELGTGIARHWGFPEPILASMAPLPEGPVQKAAFDEHRDRALAELSGALVDLLRTPEADARARGLAALQARFHKATGLDASTMRGVVTGSIGVLGRDAEILGFATRNSPFMAATRSWAGKSEVEAPAPEHGATTAVETLVNDTRIGDAEPEALDAPPEAATPERRKAVLASGVQDITQALVGEFTLNDLLRSILETMLRGIGFKRVVMCIRDAAGTALRARFGFGDGVQQLVEDGFAIPLGSSRDVFFAAISTGTDVVLPDVEDARIAPHVPAWYRSRVRARGMMLFPIVVNKRPVGLIYADADHADALALHAEELNLLKTLRNQAVLAIRQKT